MWSSASAAWQFPATLQKRLFKFLLKRVLGQCLATELDMSQLDVQLTNGVLHLKSLALNTVWLNELLGDLPFVVQKGHVHGLVVSVPWQDLFQGQVRIDIQGVEISCKPKPRIPQDMKGSSSSHWDRDYQPVTDSIHIAQMFLDDSSKEQPSFAQQQVPEESNQGLDTLAGMIDALLARMIVTLTDLRFHFSSQVKSLYQFTIHLPWAQYSDDTLPQSQLEVTRLVRFRGLSLLLSSSASTPSVSVSKSFHSVPVLWTGEEEEHYFLRVKMISKQIDLFMRSVTICLQPDHLALWQCVVEDYSSTVSSSTTLASVYTDALSESFEDATIHSSMMQSTVNLRESSIMRWKCHVLSMEILVLYENITKTDLETFIQMNSKILNTNLSSTSSHYGSLPFIHQSNMNEKKQANRPCLKAKLESVVLTLDPSLQGSLMNVTVEEIREKLVDSLFWIEKRVSPSSNVPCLVWKENQFTIQGKCHLQVDVTLMERLALYGLKTEETHPITLTSSSRLLNETPLYKWTFPSLEITIPCPNLLKPQEYHFEKLKFSFQNVEIIQKQKQFSWRMSEMALFILEDQRQMNMFTAQPVEVDLEQMMNSVTEKSNTLNPFQDPISFIMNQSLHIDNDSHLLDDPILQYQFDAMNQAQWSVNIVTKRATCHWSKQYFDVLQILINDLTMWEPKHATKTIPKDISNEAKENVAAPLRSSFCLELKVQDFNILLQPTLTFSLLQSTLFLEQVSSIQSNLSFSLSSFSFSNQEKLLFETRLAKGRKSCWLLQKSESLAQTRSTEMILYFSHIFHPFQENFDWWESFMQFMSEPSHVTQQQSPLLRRSQFKVLFHQPLIEYALLEPILNFTSRSFSVSSHLIITLNTMKWVFQCHDLKAILIEEPIVTVKDICLEWFVAEESHLRVTSEDGLHLWTKSDILLKLQEIIKKLTSHNGKSKIDNANADNSNVQEPNQVLQLLQEIDENAFQTRQINTAKPNVLDSLFEDHFQSGPLPRRPSSTSDDWTPLEASLTLPSFVHEDTIETMTSSSLHLDEFHFEKEKKGLDREKAWLEFNFPFYWHVMQGLAFSDTEFVHVDDKEEKTKTSDSNTTPISVPFMPSSNMELDEIVLECLPLKLTLFQLKNNEFLESRLIFTLDSFQVLDRVKESQLNKLVTEWMKQERVMNEPMFRILCEWTRSKEMRVEMKMSPLRCFVDEDAVQFLVEFFSFIQTHSMEQEEKGSSSDYIQYFQCHPISLCIDYQPKHYHLRDVFHWTRWLQLMPLEATEIFIGHVECRGVLLGSSLWEEWFKASLQEMSLMQTALQTLKSVQWWKPWLEVVESVASLSSTMVLLPFQTRDAWQWKRMSRQSKQWMHQTMQRVVKVGLHLSHGSKVLLEGVEALFESDSANNNTNNNANDNSQNDLNSSFMVLNESSSNQENDPISTIFAIPTRITQQDSVTGATRELIRAVPIAVLQPLRGASQFMTRTLQAVHVALDPDMKEKLREKYK